MRFLRLLSLLAVGLTCITAASAQPDLKLPSVLPAAPNAAELGRLSQLPISLSTGTMTVSLPLVSVSAGLVKADVSLAYNANGIKVDQLASRAGLGWSLNAGGVISRTVFDNPDEKSTWLNAPAGGIDNDSPEAVAFLNAASQNLDTYDTQPDIFHFNFNGYGGRFILDPSDTSKVIFLERSNLRVIRNFNHHLGGSWSLAVIDAEGRKYYFGGSGATEKTKSGSGPGCGKTYGTFVETAWYLNKIEDLAGNTVTLQYTPAESVYYTSVSQSSVGTPVSTLAQSHVVGGQTFYGRDLNSNTLCANELNTQGVVLRRIVASNGNEVRFTYRSRPDIAGDSLLTSVRLYQPGDTTAINYWEMQYALSYPSGVWQTAVSDTSVNYRPYLVRAGNHGRGAGDVLNHRFAYYDINALSPRLSFAQDHWGFFNARNNVDFVPPPGGVPSYMFPHSTANREPDSTVAAFGMLRAITYPTGGKDSIRYESHTAYLSYVKPAPQQAITINMTGFGLRGQRDTTVTFTIDHNQKVEALLNNEYSGTGVNDSIHQIGIVDIRPVGGGSIFLSTATIGETKRDSVTLSTGTYEVTFSAVGEASQVHAVLTYTTGSDSLKYHNEIIGGVRVKQLLTYDPVTSATLTRTFRYARLDSLGKSSGVLVRGRPVYYGDMQVQQVDEAYGSTGAMFCNYKTANSNGTISLYGQDGSHLVYSDVVESDGSTFTNGGSWHRYAVQYDAPPTLIRGLRIPMVSYNQTGIPQALEYYLQRFKYEGGGMIPVDEQYTYHQQQNFERVTAYAASKNYEVSAGGDFPYNAMSYELSSQWVHNDSTTTLTYDDNGLNPIRVHVEYTYGNEQHLQVTHTETTGSDGISRASDFRYPAELVAEGTTVPYQAMINHNQVTALIRKDDYAGGTLQLRTLTTYSNSLSPDSANYLPEKVRTQYQTEAMEDRLLYRKYDTYGNLLEVSMAGGPVTAYQWEYSGQYPVAEVRNATTVQFFYEDFEVSGNTANAHTGLKGKSGGYTLSFGIPDGRSYVYSYWALQDGSWVYSGELPYSASVTLSGTVDDVCVHPVDADMVNRAFSPLRGVTATTDDRGNTMYYQYDAFNRVSAILDRFGNKIKTFTYHFGN